MFFECFAMISNNFFSLLYNFFLFDSFFSLYKQRELIGLFCGLKKEHLRVKDKKILVFYFAFWLFVFFWYFSHFFVLHPFGKKRFKRFLIVAQKTRWQSCWLESRLIISRSSSSYLIQKPLTRYQSFRFNFHFPHHLLILRGP